MRIAINLILIALTAFLVWVLISSIREPIKFKAEKERRELAVIEKLMCDFAFSRDWALDTFGAPARTIIEEADYLAASDRDGLFSREENVYRVTDTGRPFVRVIAAHFDAYLHKGAARHSAAV